MNQAEVLEIFRKVGAFITDSHIVYTSGRHGSTYINKDALYPDTEITDRLCMHMAFKFSVLEEVPEAVIAPAIGAILLANRTAHYLNALTQKKVLAVYAEKENGGFVIRRGYDKLIAGKRVLVVEDTLTTGCSVRKVVELVRTVGGEIVGVGALCNRGSITKEELGVPRLFALMNIRMDSWPEEECPLCLDNVPINTEVGKGREFLARGL
jgi:orotate phosphoribosyltransferase